MLTPVSKKWNDDVITYFIEDKRFQRPRKRLEGEGALTKKGTYVLQERHFYSMKIGHFHSRKGAHFPQVQKVCVCVGGGGGGTCPQCSPVPRPLNALGLRSFQMWIFPHFAYALKCLMPMQ